MSSNTLNPKNIKEIKGTSLRRIQNDVSSYSVINSNGNIIKFSFPDSIDKEKEFLFVDINSDDGVVELITKRGEIFYFDPNEDSDEIILNEDMSAGIGVGDIGTGTSGYDDTCSVNYKDVTDALMIPFISHYRFINTPRRKTSKKRRKRNRK